MFITNDRSIFLTLSYQWTYTVVARLQFNLLEKDLGLKFTYFNFVAQYNSGQVLLGRSFSNIFTAPYYFVHTKLAHVYEIVLLLKILDILI